MSIKLQNIFKIDSAGVPYVKLVYWGPSLAGKTTALTIYNVLKKLENPEQIYSDLKKIEDPSGRTLFYDHTTFELPKGQGTSLPAFRYQVWSVAGQKRHKHQRAVVLTGADGIIIMFDVAKAQWENNVDSLKELIEVTKGELGKSIPYVVVLNKIDLPADQKTPTEDFVKLLVDLGVEKDTGSAVLKVIETSCLQAKEDLKKLLSSPDRDKYLDEYGRLKRAMRPESVKKVAMPIEHLTREIIVKRIEALKKKIQSN